MDWTEFWIILLGIAGLWFLYIAVKNIIDTIRIVKRCSEKVTADILFWTEEEDSDNPTRYIPTIRYSHGGQSYETFYLDGALTWYQKKHRDTGDTLTIFLDPENPATITPEHKRRSMLQSIGLCICIGIAVFPFILFAIGILFI